MGKYKRCGHHESQEQGGSLPLTSCPTTSGRDPSPSPAWPQRPEGSDFASLPVPAPQAPSWLMVNLGLQAEGGPRNPRVSLPEATCSTREAQTMGWDSPERLLPFSQGPCAHLCRLLFPEVLHPFHPQNRALCLSLGPLSAQCPQGRPTSRDGPLLRMCECVRVCGGGQGKWSGKPL